jgi:hypothetical protein
MRIFSQKEVKVIKRKYKRKPRKHDNIWKVEGEGTQQSQSIYLKK